VRVRNEPRLVLPDTEAASTLAELLRTAHVTVELDPDFSSAAWRKLLVNAVVGVMVLTGRRSGAFRRDDVAALGAGIWLNASPSRAPRVPTSATR
jgi:2-dehydropantoate 2-reductase